MKTKRLTLRNVVIKNLSIALSYIDNAHEALATALKDEKSSTATERSDLYDYGLSDVDIQKVKLANVKKSILSITGNHSFNEAQELNHAA